MKNKSLHILLIEDNPGDVRLVKEYLNESPRTYELSHVNAIQDKPEETYDALLLDLHLDDTSGSETFAHAKEVYSHLPIVILTGLDDENFATQLVKEGAHDYLVKGKFDSYALDRSIRYSIERKRYEDELRESELRFHNLADTSPMYIAMADEAGNAIYFNRPWLEFTGKKLPEMLGLGWLSTLHPEDAPAFEQDFRNAFEKRIPVNEQYRFKRADGEYRWMFAVGAPRYTPDGKFIGYFGTYTDFHELKQTQIAQQESEEHYRTLFNSIDSGFCVLEIVFDKKKRPIDYIFREANTIFEKQTGLTDVIGKRMKDIAPGHEDHWFERYGNVALTGEAIRFEDSAKELNRIFEVYAYRFGEPEDHQVAVLFTDITARKELEKQIDMKKKMDLLTEQRNALLKINKTKNEFISLASHQLRTPATTVKQYVGLLLENFAGALTPDQSTFLRIAYESNERELNIINDLLKTAQLDASQYRLDKQPHDIDALIRECIAEMASTFILKNQKPQYDREESPLMLPIDRTEMKVVFMNLLENASKYSYPDTTIKIVLTELRSNIDIAVIDQGVGISPENQRRVFDKFTRVDNTMSDTVTGTGLGLYWVKRIVKLHNGKVSVTSKLNEGSTFKIRLPL